MEPCVKKRRSELTRESIAGQASEGLLLLFELDVSVNANARHSVHSPVPCPPQSVRSAAQRVCIDAGATTQEPRFPYYVQLNPSRLSRQGPAGPHQRQQNSSLFYHPSSGSKPPVIHPSLPCFLILSAIQKQQHNGSADSPYPRRLRGQGPVRLHPSQGRRRSHP